MTNSFSDNCLYLYNAICVSQDVDRKRFFNYCVDTRLNELFNDNSNQLDYLLNNLEKYIDSIITEKPIYERCSNYKERERNKVKHNLNWMKRLYKQYNKSCISSVKLLNKLVDDWQQNEKR